MKISGGGQIQHTPGSDLAAGDVVEFADMIGVVDSAIAAGALGSVSVSGLYELPRVSAVLTAIPAGTVIDWDTANNYAKEGGSFRIGHSVEVSGRFDATILVLLSY